MLTVGQMVFAESAPFRPEGEDDTAQMGAAMVVERLQSLGIWDAEVLDAKPNIQFSSVDGTRTHQLLSFGRKRPFKRLGIDYLDGKSVRVIVLKEE